MPAPARRSGSGAGASTRCPAASASRTRGSSDATVAALAVVNAVGDVVGDDGAVLAGSTAPPGAPGFPDAASVRGDGEHDARRRGHRRSLRQARLPSGRAERARRPRAQPPPLAHPLRRRPRDRVRDRRGRRAPRSPPGRGRRRRRRVDSCGGRPWVASPVSLSASSHPANAPVATLAEVAALAHDCTLCKLAAGARRSCSASAAPTPTCMFVGEGPGEQEDLQGEPFVGPRRASC